MVFLILRRDRGRRGTFLLAAGATATGAARAVEPVIVKKLAIFALCGRYKG